MKNSILMAIKPGAVIVALALLSTETVVTANAFCGYCGYTIVPPHQQCYHALGAGINGFESYECEQYYNEEMQQYMCHLTGTWQCYFGYEP